jgi:hypothetical protein
VAKRNSRTFTISMRLLPPLFIVGQHWVADYLQIRVQLVAGRRQGMSSE